MLVLGKIPRGYTLHDADRQFAEDKPEKQDKRSAFEIDKGRIIHSSAFRRLQGKTQVLGAGERDFYRTRLTHSLEVAQIGRGICNEISNPKDFTIDTDLVEAICLAHDIGHPPFGHSGEGLLNGLTYAEGGFGANAQNLRVVTFVETKRKEGGLNLSRAALDGLTKYPTLFDWNKFRHKQPEFVYREHSSLLDWIKDGVRRPETTPVECQIAEWADTLAYSVNDIEDNFRAGIIDFVEMEKRAPEIAAVGNGHTVDEVVKEARYLQKRLVIDPRDLRERKASLKSWTSGTIFALLSGCSFYIRGATEKSNRYKYGFLVPDVNKRKAKLLKAVALVLAFRDPRVKTLEFKGNQIIGELYKTFCANQSLLPRDFQEMVREDKKNAKRIVADFVSGMTDSYAKEYYSRLFEPRGGSFYQDV